MRAAAILHASTQFDKGMTTNRLAALYRGVSRPTHPSGTALRKRSRPLA
jgi:hypothetical protein